MPDLRPRCLPRLGLLLLPALLAAAPVSQPATMPATMPSTMPATIPATRPLPIPPMTRPATRPATLPATRLATRPATRPADVQALLDGLGADAFADRERAQRALVARGSSVKADAQDLADHAADPEVRSRAAAVVRGLEREAHFGASRITLHLKKVGPKKAFDALAAAAGATFAYAQDDPWGPGVGDPAKPLSLDADAEPFWAVFRRLSLESGADVQQWGNDGAFTITRSGQTSEYPACLSGPFVAEVHSLSWDDNRSIDLNHFDPKQPDRAEHAANRSLSVQFVFGAEPKLKVLRVLQVATLTEATDDRGKSLLPEKPADQPYMQQEAGYVWQSAASLDPDAAAGAKRLKTLRGTTRVEVASSMASIVLDPIAVGKSASAGGVRVTVTSFDPTGPQPKLGLKIVRPRTGDANDLPTGSIRLLDAKARPLSQSGGSTSDDGQTLTLEYLYNRPDGNPDGGDPAKLTWDVPVGRETLDLPFEFHDLPLP